MHWRDKYFQIISFLCKLDNYNITIIHAYNNLQYFKFGTFKINQFEVL